MDEVWNCEPLGLEEGCRSRLRPGLTLGEADDFLILGPSRAF